MAKNEKEEHSGNLVKQTPENQSATADKPATAGKTEQNSPSESLVREFIEGVRKFSSALARRGAEYRDDEALFRHNGRREKRKIPSPALRRSLDEEVLRTRERLHTLLRFSREKGAPLYLATLCEKRKLSREETEILAVLFYYQLFCLDALPTRDCTPRNLAFLLSPHNAYDAIRLYPLFHPLGTLAHRGLVEQGRRAGPFFSRREGLGADFNIDEECYLGNDVYTAMLEETIVKPHFAAKGVKRRKRRRARNEGGYGRFGGKLVEIEKPRLTLDDVILPDDIRERLKVALLIQGSEQKFRKEWGLREFYFKGAGSAVLLAGPPGTGKTLTAQAIAGTLRRPLGTVRYETLFNCWVGMSEKSVVRAFEEARREKAILFFDECDALIHTRGKTTETSAGQMSERLVSLLLQHIEGYDGLVIFSTNHAGDLDPALDRRLSARIEFPLPLESQREEIWRKHIPLQLALSEDVNLKLLAKRYALSGGYIKNAIIEATRTLIARKADDSSVADILTMELLESAARNQTEQMKQREKTLGFVTES